MKRDIARATFTIISIAAICVAVAVPATAQSIPGIGTVMTYNVNEGTDFLQAVGAPNVQQFLLDVGQILMQVEGTNPPERMQAVARQILTVQPELLSLQEVDHWYSGFGSWDFRFFMARPILVISVTARKKNVVLDQDNRLPRTRSATAPPATR
jgi:hypothetical protein